MFYLYKLSQLCVGGVMCNEESQTVVGDLHWSRSVHFQTHKALLIKKEDQKNTVLQRGICKVFEGPKVFLIFLKICFVPESKTAYEMNFLKTLHNFSHELMCLYELSKYYSLDDNVQSD